MYLLDSNVFIEAKNRYYSFDLCPGFWEWVDKEHGNGTVCSISHVKDELLAGGDDLSDWARSRPSSFWLEVDSTVVPSMTTVSQMVDGFIEFQPNAKAEFLRVADYFLVAHAHASNHTIVTHEVASNSAKRIKIPNVCRDLSVPVMPPFQMLKTEGASFVLP